MANYVVIVSIEKSFIENINLIGILQEMMKFEKFRFNIKDEKIAAKECKLNQDKRFTAHITPYHHVTLYMSANWVSYERS